MCKAMATTNKSTLCYLLLLHVGYVQNAITSQVEIPAQL